MTRVYKNLQFSVFQEALSNYCDATHKLIKSADTAGHKSKNEARELSKVFKEFVQGVNAHQKVVSINLKKSFAFNI